MSDGERSCQQGSLNVDLAVVKPGEVRFRNNDRGEAEFVNADGSVHSGIRIIPAFPISRPSRFVYVQDREGRDLGVIVDPRRLDRESRDIVLSLADQAYFMPRITRILRVEERSGTGIARWEVETDRGFSAFDIVARSESVWYVGKDRLVIRDADGNRYLVEDLNALDKRSRRLAEIYL